MKINDTQSMFRTAANPIVFYQYDINAEKGFDKHPKPYIYIINNNFHLDDFLNLRIMIKRNVIFVAFIIP